VPAVWPRLRQRSQGAHRPLQPLAEATRERSVGQLLDELKRREVLLADDRTNDGTRTIVTYSGSAVSLTSGGWHAMLGSVHTRKQYSMYLK